jgi:hypothetical protein
MQHAAGSRQIHDLLAGLPRFGAAFSALDLPRNGIYLFYELGETFSDGDRIVRIGTHVGDARLPKRLKLHYAGRARRSVFRRNVGNALVRAGMVEGISSSAAPFGSDQFGPELEKAISARFAETFTFSVVQVDEMSARLRLEAGLIASLTSESALPPSSNWLGHHSTVAAVRESGLWNKNHVGGTLLSLADFELLRHSI